MAVSGYGASNSSVLLDVEIPIVYDVTVVTSETAGIQCRDLLESNWCHLTSQAGPVTIAGLKTANLLVQTETGDVTCCGAHHPSYVAGYEVADVRMVGVDGTVSVYMKAGRLDMQISCIRGESRVHLEEGDIQLKVSESFPLKLCVTGTQVEADEKFSSYGSIEAKEEEESYEEYNGAVQPDQFSALCQVTADQGRVSLAAQDWAASLGFKLRK